MKHNIRTKEVKESISKVAFELFAKEHGGTDEDKKQLWIETDESIKNEYHEKAKNNIKTIVTSRSSRKIKLPARYGNSVKSSTAGIKPTKKSSFDNFVKIKQAQDSKLTLEKLKSEWNLFSDEEKKEFKTASMSGMDYKALDEGDLFFNSDEEEEYY